MAFGIGIGISPLLTDLSSGKGGIPPSNLISPVLSGTAQEGQTLTCSNGAWVGESPITYTYQWKRNGSNIGSATNSTYTLVTADVGQSIKCTVTATNAVGSANADSNTVVPIAAFSFLLDTYTGAAAAYSFRKLRSAYSGNCIRVRRSSDNTEQNIGFVNNVLDTASLLSFVGAGNGFVTTWYDQSGNTVNATQSTAAYQPQIVSSGNLVLSNGKVTMNAYNASLNNSLVMNPAGLTQATFTVMQNETTLNAGVYLIPYGTIGTQLGSQYFGVCQSGNSSSPHSGVGTPTYHKNGGSALTSTRGALYTAYATGSMVLSSTMGGSLPLQSNRFMQYTDNNSFGGNYKVSECVMYLSDQSSNKSGIESNINTFYTIY